MTQITVQNPSLFVTVTEWFFHATQNVWREYRMRQATRILGGLEDRELNDMGIPRSGIEDAVRFGRSGVRPIRP